MFIAHLPAGYLLTKLIQKITGKQKYMGIGLTASILPDIDLLYFYFFNSNQSHHTFFTHLPMFWFFLLFLLIGFAAIFTRTTEQYIKCLLLFLVFFGNIFLHMILDTYAASIGWFYPFYNHNFELIHVPAKYDWWVLSFVLHWSFLGEIVIIIAALGIFSINKINGMKPWFIKS